MIHRRCKVNLNLNNIVLGAFIGLIGLALLMYGRKAVRLPHMGVGLILIVYPYFIGSFLVEIIVAVVLIAGLGLISRLGF